MATAYTSDKKIGALDTASTPLSAANELVINQGGDILKTPLSAVEAKMFDAKTATTTPAGTEVVVVRQTDNTLRQVALADIVPALNITNAKVSASAAIADTKLATIATAGKVLNSATTATDENTNNAIVARDGSGNFSAGTITATLAGSITGNAATATAAATLTTGRTIALTGDVTGTTATFNGSANVSATTTIANDAVTTAKILDGNVTLAKLVAAVQQSLVPAGAVQAFAMNSAPQGWLTANGSNVSRSTYSSLFAAIGTTYGSGDGSTTFALPDLRGYFLRGSGTNSDGSAAGTFGEKVADALKTHTHSVSGNTGTESVGHTHSVSGTTGNDSPDHGHAGFADTQGAHSHNTYALRASNTAVGGSSNRITGIVYPGSNPNDTGGTDVQGAHGHNIQTYGAQQRHQHPFSATSGGVSAAHTHGVNITSGNPSTGTSDETRPKNIAMLYCIKF
jgi:microcystin-dependent protein